MQDTAGLILRVCVENTSYTRFLFLPSSCWKIFDLFEKDRSLKEITNTRCFADYRRIEKLGTGSCVVGSIFFMTFVIFVGIVSVFNKLSKDSDIHINIIIPSAVLLSLAGLFWFYYCYSVIYMPSFNDAYVVGPRSVPHHPEEQAGFDYVPM